MAPPIGKPQIKLNAVMFSMLLEQLLDRPRTAQEIAEHTGMGLLTVKRTLRVMHRRQLVHISGWRKGSTGRQEIRVFGWGFRPDVPRPGPKRRKTVEEALTPGFRATNKTWAEANSVFSLGLAA